MLGAALCFVLRILSISRDAECMLQRSGRCDGHMPFADTACRCCLYMLLTDFGCRRTAQTWTISCSTRSPCRYSPAQCIQCNKSETNRNESIESPVAPQPHCGHMTCQVVQASWTAVMILDSQREKLFEGLASAYFTMIQPAPLSVRSTTSQRL